MKISTCIEGQAGNVLIQVLLVALVAGLAVGVGVQHTIRLKLVNEHEMLAEEASQMAGRVAQNEQWSNRLAQLDTPKRLSSADFKELLQLRGEVGLLRQQTQNVENARRENCQVHSILDQYQGSQAAPSPVATTNFWPNGTWANSGFASPEAALQTLFWSLSNGDITNTYACLSEQMQKKEPLPTDDRAMEASARAMDGSHYAQFISVLDHSAPDENTAVLTVAIDDWDGFEITHVTLRKSGNEWKLDELSQ